METNKNGLEVDNNEIYYWSYAGEAFENSASGSWTGHVHHNNIHHIAGEGYGYGVMVAYGDVLIEANNFDYTRHAVIGEGCPGRSLNTGITITERTVLTRFWIVTGIVEGGVQEGCPAGYTSSITTQ